MATPTNDDHNQARALAGRAWATPGCDVMTVADAVAQALADERARTLLDFAALIDRGPTLPLPPSVFSAMARERAQDQTS